MIGETTVTLIDGRQVSSNSEEWRAECEARAVCRLRTRLNRHDYMERVKEKRGEESAEALRQLVLRVWNAQFQRQW